jgi:hypothetical protein
MIEGIIDRPIRTARRVRLNLVRRTIRTVGKSNAPVMFGLELVVGSPESREFRATQVLFHELLNPWRSLGTRGSNPTS